jgi:hypothetical protein
MHSTAYQQSWHQAPCVMTVSLTTEGFELRKYRAPPWPTPGAPSLRTNSQLSTCSEPSATWMPPPKLA